MANKETQLSDLSVGELDELINHGIQQQETVLRHGSKYQHFLNVVAMAKHEKAIRGEDDKKKGTGKTPQEHVDLVKDTEVDENPLASARPAELDIPDDKGKQSDKGVSKAVTANNPDGMEVNQGLPGLEKVETSPENVHQNATDQK